MIFNSKEDWKTSDLNVDSLWLYDKRDNSGKHDNSYHGNFIPQIPNQLIRRYTKEQDVVVELFSGSGTTLYECEQLNRKYIGFDINGSVVASVKAKMTDNMSCHYLLHQCDVTDTDKMTSLRKFSLKSFGIEYADFLIAHPPYMDVVKFSDNENDLSQISDLTVFLEKFVTAMKNGLDYLKKGKYFSIVIGDIYKNSEVIPLGFFVIDSIKKNFKVKLKGIVVKNIEGNRGKLNSQAIWKYRALQSDYFLFKHEYILVFKKEF